MYDDKVHWSKKRPRLARIEIDSAHLKAEFQAMNPNQSGPCEVLLPLPPQIISLADLEVTLNSQPSESVEIRGWNLEQQEVSVKGRGYLARAFQHEMDHLDGILIWDRMSKIQREILKNEWKRYQRDAGKG